MSKRKSSGDSVSTPTTVKRQKQETPGAQVIVQIPNSSIRSSGRIQKQSGSSKLAQKSKYFEESDREASTDSEGDEKETLEASGDEDNESGYEDEDASMTEASESEAESEGYNSEEDRPNKTKRPKRRLQQADKDNGDDEPTEVLNKSDLWREGVKTGLGPGKAVYIEKPKARGDGGIKFVPDKIHPNTFEFLKDLKRNNDRVWLKAHDADFRASWKDWESFVEVLTEKIAAIDDTIPELPPKDLVFRIYRDVRFSKDPTPYKPHFSAAWSRTGRKGPYACYYVQIQAGGKSFVGSGLWHPDSRPVALLRDSIDKKSKPLKEVLMSAGMRKLIFGGISRDERKAVKAFCLQNAENALKTRPKGYPAEHADIDLLRLRNFTVGQKIADEAILECGLSRILELVTAMQPFVTYLNSIVMPDDADVEDLQSNESDGEGSDANSSGESP